MIGKALFFICIPLSIAVTFYCIVSVISVDGTPKYVASALGVFLVVVLLLAGLVDKTAAGKGLIVSVLAFLPTLREWALGSPERAVAIAVAGILIGIGAIWMGPLGVHQYSIACDEANEVAIDGDSFEECSVTANKTVWRMPWDRSKAVEITCSRASGEGIDFWTKSVSGRNLSISCGERPLTLATVRDGITIPAAFSANTTMGSRVARNMDSLRVELSQLPDRKKTDNLLIGTWNVRELGVHTSDDGARTARSEEAELYVAQILSHFDLVALQEVFDIRALHRIVAHLEPNYGVALGAPSPGACGREGMGGERLGFVYDRRKLRLLDENSTVVIDGRSDRRMLATYPDWADAVENFEQEQPCRPPFLARFDSQGWEFSIFTLHAYFGRNTGELHVRRLVDLYRIFSHFGRLQRRADTSTSLLFAGDLNASDPGGPEQQVVEALGFDLFGRDAQRPTNVAQTKAYSRIGVLHSDAQGIAAAHDGIFAAFDVVYRDDQLPEYRSDFSAALRAAQGNWIAENEELFYRRWRTYQISDANLKWVEFRFLESRS